MRVVPDGAPRDEGGRRRGTEKRRQVAGQRGPVQSAHLPPLEWTSLQRLPQPGSLERTLGSSMSLTLQTRRPM